MKPALSSVGQASVLRLSLCPSQPAFTSRIRRRVCYGRLCQIHCASPTPCGLCSIRRYVGQVPRVRVVVRDQPARMRVLQRSLDGQLFLAGTDHEDPSVPAFSFFPVAQDRAAVRQSGLHPGS